MKKNIGDIDRIVRFALGALLVLVGFLVKMNSAVLPIILVILGAALIATAAIRFCPVYVPFKFSTKK